MIREEVIVTAAELIGVRSTRVADGFSIGTAVEMIVAGAGDQIGSVDSTYLMTFPIFWKSLKVSLSVESKTPPMSMPEFVM